MPIVPTARLGLNTWTAGTDPFTRPQRNADAGTLDGLVAIYGQGAFADRPAAGTEGRFYLVDDAGDVDHDGELYYDNGAAWRLVNASADLTPYATDADLAAHAGAADPHPGYATDADLAAHAVAGDPHPTYTTAAELAAGIGGHEAAANPHPTYATDADLAAHAVAGDPHPGYLTPAEGNAAYLGIAAKAADSELLDGLDSLAFARSTVDLNTPRRYLYHFLLGG